MRGRWKLLAGFGVLITGFAKADVIYDPLSDWASLPDAHTGVTAGLFSSYDRNEDTLGLNGLANTNNDRSQYIGTTPDGWDIEGSITGPGVVTRLWMPALTASETVNSIRIIADGTLNPDGSVTGGTTILNTTTQKLFSGAGGQASTSDASSPSSIFSSPLVNTLAGGEVSYEPIAFSKSLVVEIKPAVGSQTYYQLNYHALPQATPIATYNHGQLTSSQQTARQQAATIASNTGANPGGVDPGAITHPTSGSVASGQSLSLASLSGGGTIEALKINFSSALAGLTSAQQNTILNGMRLQISYDGSTQKAVDVPVSQFFGVGNGRAAYQSAPMGVSPSDGSYYCYFPMPFRAGASVQLVNSSGVAVNGLNASVQYSPTTPAANAQEFHAIANSQTTVAGQANYNLATLNGVSGTYVGNIMSIGGVGKNHALLEGDDSVVVNGTQQQLGTGFEDAYNGGYYFNHIADENINGDPSNPTSGQSAYSGLLQDTDGTSAPFEVDAYRWMIGDYIPFTNSISVNQENYGIGSGVNFASTAFFYESVPEPMSISVLLSGALIFGLPRRRR